MTRDSSQQLSLTEKEEMKKTIMFALCQKPYSLQTFLLDFINSADEGVTVAPDLMYDKIDYAISCNETITCSTLHELILATQGNLV